MKNETKEKPTSEPASQTSRRKFIAGTAAATAAASALPIESYAQVAGSDMIKVGMIGCGGRGSGAIVQDLTASDNAQLYAMGDAFQDKIDGTGVRATGLPVIQKNLEKSGKGKQVDVPASRQFSGFDAYKKVIDACDLVVIATPPGFRPYHFEAAVEAGKHIFMEKPVCVDAAGYNKVIKAAEIADQKKLKVVVGLQRHYQDSYLKALEKVRAGEIGELISGQCWWNSGGVWTVERQPGWSEMEYQMRNWYYFNWLCGDHICEQHIHNIDVLNWFFSDNSETGGNPISAQGMGGREVRVGPNTGEIFDHHYVEFRYEGDKVGNSQCRHQKNCMNKVEEEIHGSEGILYTSSGKARIVDHKGKEVWNYRNRKAKNPYQIEHDVLHQHIRDNKPINNAHYAAKSSFTTVLGRLATYSGKNVTWDEAVKSDFSIMPKEFAFDAAPLPVPNKDGLYPTAKPGQWPLPWAKK
ncbi:MAG: Gfo/Idh/MocA family oxidoreductase [Verrucomicrobiota bacterium]